jgi:hypothetical protein
MKIVDFFLIIWGKLSELEPEPHKNGPAPQHCLHQQLDIEKIIFSVETLQLLESGFGSTILVKGSQKKSELF